MKKINELKEKLFNITEGFASKTGDYAQITKLTMEIKTFETKRSGQYEELGRIVFKKIEEGGDNLTLDTELREQAGKITELEKKIIEKQAEIDQIKTKTPEDEDNSSSSDPQDS